MRNQIKIANQTEFKFLSETNTQGRLDPYRRGKIYGLKMDSEYSLSCSLSLSHTHWGIAAVRLLLVAHPWKTSLSAGLGLPIPLV